MRILIRTFQVIGKTSKCISNFPDCRGDDNLYRLKNKFYYFWKSTCNLFIMVLWWIVFRK